MRNKGFITHDIKIVIICIVKAWHQRKDIQMFIWWVICSCMLKDMNLLCNNPLDDYWHGEVDFISFTITPVPTHQHTYAHKHKQQTQTQRHKNIKNV